MLVLILICFDLLFGVMACTNFVQIIELGDVSVILTCLMDRSSAMALYTTRPDSWVSFCEVRGARFCYALEWVADKIQLINDEYLETLMDCGLIDEDEMMGLVEMDHACCEMLARRCKLLFDAYQQFRDQAFTIDCSLSRVRVRSVPQYVIQRRGWEEQYDLSVASGWPWRYALRGPNGWYVEEEGVLPLLLADGWFIDLPGQRQNFGYAAAETPGDEVFFNYLRGDLDRELKALISVFRGNSLRAQENHLARRLLRMYESDTWIPEWWRAWNPGCHITRDELWSEERNNIIDVVLPRQDREERLALADMQGSRLISVDS